VSAHSIRWESWDLAARSDREFRRTLLMTALPILLLAIIVTWLRFPELPHEEVTYKPPRYAELLPPPPPPPVKQPQPAVETPKPTPAPQPKPKPKPVEKPQPKPKPQPTPEERKANARAQVQKKFGAAFDQLSALRDQSLSANLKEGPTAANIISSQSPTGAPPAFAAAAGQGSAGIGRGSSVTGSSNGVGLGSRNVAGVHSSVGTGSRLAEKNGVPVRSLEEIQKVFDRNKGAFYAIFNRAARQNAAIGAGKIVISLTIAPDGSVTRCSLVSSTFGDSDLERKIVERVKLLNFGAKPVPPFTYPNYPINYIPPGA
jgi:TonB family protein